MYEKLRAVTFPVEKSEMAEQGTLSFKQTGDATLEVHLAGTWRLRGGIPSAALVKRELESAPRMRHIGFEARALTSWDSSVLAFLVEVSELCRIRGIDMDRTSLPSGLGRLLDLAEAVPEKKGARKETVETHFLERIGNTAIGAGTSLGEMLAFLGDMTLTFVRLFRMKVRFRAVDLLLLIQQSGAQALPIVSLISFLVGVILAYVGAVQLRQFGAQIYVADLVGIGMTREMGAMVAAVIMAGRTGAAFAAELGTMQVNEEIDALATLGISPIEFLVLPRMLALAVMMPLLALYADLLGLLGGMAVGVGMLDLGVVEYYVRTVGAIGIEDCVAGLIKASLFGVLIAVAGCLRGIQCGRSSAAVGAATTSAVVTGIVLIIVSDAATTVIFDLIGL